MTEAIKDIQETESISIIDNIKLHRVEEYIFAPFDTFLFLDSDELYSSDMEAIKIKLIEYLNNEVPDNLKNKVFWKMELSDELKASKGVFRLPGRENSFIAAEMKDTEDLAELMSLICLESGPPTRIIPKKINFYFNDSGVGSCCLDLSISCEEGLTTNELDELSEKLNNLFKGYLEEICFELTVSYRKAINFINVPHFKFSFIPDIHQIDKSQAFLPWTHRIYHIHDHGLFELENPGDPFKKLLTPTASTDVENFAIYPDRYIYFGWGHSIIITKDNNNIGMPESNININAYVRLLQIAQANWHCLDNISKIIELARLSFYKDIHNKRKKIKILTTNIVKVRNFTKCIETVLDNFEGINITFDTEKRKLLEELHKRWLQQDLISRVRNKLTVIEEFLDFLYIRKKEQHDGSLNTILSVITIISVVEVIKAFIEFSNPVFNFAPEFNLISFSIGSILTVICILVFAFRR